MKINYSLKVQYSRTAMGTSRLSSGHPTTTVHPIDWRARPI